MVRNLVLTPFIDLGPTHFIFSCRKISKLLAGATGSKERSNNLRSIIFFRAAPIELSKGQLWREESDHD
jgi:hypothetical protein